MALAVRLFETLFEMRDDIRKVGVGVLWSTVGWNHVFKNALTLLRIAGRSRQSIDNTIERDDTRAFVKLSSSITQHLLK